MPARSVRPRPPWCSATPARRTSSRRKVVGRTGAGSTSRRARASANRPRPHRPRLNPWTAPRQWRGGIAAALSQAIWRDRGRVCLAVGLLLVAKAAAIAVPLVLKLIVDELTPGAGAGPVPPAGFPGTALGMRLAVTMPVFLV